MCSHNLVGFHLNYFFIKVYNSKNSLIYSKVMRNPVSFVSINIQKIMRKNHFITDDKVVPVDFGRCEKYSGSFFTPRSPSLFLSDCESNQTNRPKESFQSFVSNTEKSCTCSPSGVMLYNACIHANTHTPTHIHTMNEEIADHDIKPNLKKIKTKQK